MLYSVISGINIHYEGLISGAPLLMMAPGGFDSTIEKGPLGNIGQPQPPKPLGSGSSSS